ncbi:hypothetical protein ACJMK2_013435 [Sinanodonta woodiana]|uniref:Uncharacterized protein n=1 Tax=Sinanodonta woodiana TaxID=1069815 RepID=A0ABD3UY64_SINWO
MCPMVYPVYPKVPPPETYGFRKVSSKELADILSRLSRKTYNRQISTEEQRHTSNYEHLLLENGRRRTPSSCRKSSVLRRDIFSAGDANKRRLTDHEMRMLLRRLQKPTETFKIATTTQEPHKEEEDNLRQRKIIRTKSSDEIKTKVIAKYRRPTTASRAKSVDVCHLCYDHETKKQEDGPDAFDYDYSDPTHVPPEEVPFIVERMLKPTVASRGGTSECKYGSPYIDEVKIRENLPLLSGLPRSRTVHEITQRLSSKGRHAYRPEATQISTF